MRRFRTLIPFLAAAALGAGLVAARADEAACNLLFYGDAELMKVLPERVRAIFEAKKFQTYFSTRGGKWAPFHSTLDRAFADLGEEAGARGRPFVARLDALETMMYFRRGKKGEVELWVDVLAKKGLPIGANDEGAGADFLEFFAAQVEWMAKARADGRLPEGLALVGKELRNRRLIDLLEPLGFKRGRAPGAECYFFGAIGGLAGYGGGRAYFQAFDGSVENGSIYEEQRKYYRDVVAGGVLGAGGAVALACFRKVGRNYSIEFKPGELPAHPDKLPDDVVPPIDQSPPVEPIWPPKPLPPGLPAPVGE